jgi:DNA polymerase (family 10)
MSRADMTKRIITAMESGYVDILAHPTDRIINTRNPIDIDLDRVFEAAHDNGVVLEIDGYPERLDLNDENIIRARKCGARFSIDTDSHRTSHLSLMSYGVSTAKRGWVLPSEAINTLRVDRVLKALKK